ncbi:MAG: acetolactate synthase large subunit [Rhizobiaceae bacterium]|nr:acetolactate synthase large subunit [Rhizobiaceae bacterium]
MNGADTLADTLLHNGIDVCFANPGTSEMHFVAALDRKPEMRCVLGLFEGVVTGAADGYARMAEKPAATLLHLGPGLANGLANLHNAKRANTPIVNVVGDHATYHLQHDAPLQTDIEGLARPMSHWVKTTASSETVAADAAEAISVACTAPGQIATLILPADAAWSPTNAAVVSASVPTRPMVSEDAVRTAAAALRSGRRALILLGGEALRAKPLEAAGRIAATTGARLLAQQANGRIERGAGRVSLDRVFYRVDAALDDLREVEVVILVGAKAPVGFFAYPGKPGAMLPEGCQVTVLSQLEEDGVDALDRLADALAIPASVAPRLGRRAELAPPTGGPLTTASIAAAVAALLPENAIVVDESISSGFDFFRFTHEAAPHDFLQLTGGAIGTGMPLAAGAAIACPDRKVVVLQADGSGMYTVQALWTHARENLDVVTIIYANRSYAILRDELRQVGAGEPGENARAMLDLDRPELDWVSLAKGMGVEAGRADDAAEFVRLLRAAVSRRGPFVIEARI